MADSHVEREDHPWSVNISDHPMRSESSMFRAAKKAAKLILAQHDTAEPYGPGLWEMHHGGSLWVYSRHAGARLFRARVGIEWSMQFCADPALVDLLRLDAVALYEAFPDTIPWLLKLGYDEAPDLLTTPIKTAEQVANWTDSLFNACVPLDRGNHSGVLPNGAGYHHYPAPIKDADFFRRADFELWVEVAPQQFGAVAPLAPRGAGDGRTRLMYAPTGTAARAALKRAQDEGKALILPADHPVSRQAYARQ